MIEISFTKYMSGFGCWIEILGQRLTGLNVRPKCSRVGTRPEELDWGMYYVNPRGFIDAIHLCFVEDTDLDPDIFKRSVGWTAGEAGLNTISKLAWADIISAWDAFDSD